MKKLIFVLCFVNLCFGFYCYEPTKPYCVDFGKFNSNSEFEQCKMEVENYLKKLQEYINAS